MALKEKHLELSSALLPEFDHEMIATRKHLERIPEDKLSWKPHQKSFTMGELGMHIAQVLAMADVIINKEEMAMPGEMHYEAAASVSSILETYEKNCASARAMLAETEDDSFQKPWSLVKDGKKLLTMPRIAVVRSFIFNHLYHHRAQLGVYLRLNNIAVPATYGPSADEGMM